MMTFARPIYLLLHAHVTPLHKLTHLMFGIDLLN